MECRDGGYCKTFREICTVFDLCKGWAPLKLIAPVQRILAAARRISSKGAAPLVTAAAIKGIFGIRAAET